MTDLHISLLGPFEVILEDEVIRNFVSVKVRALLAYLAAETGRPQARTTLAGMLWPDYPDASALKSLRQALYSLRRTLHNPPCLESDRQSITLLHGDDCRVDVLELEQALAKFRGNRTPDGRLLTARMVVDGLQSAVALYCGPFLEGFTLSGNPEFEAWVLSQREHYCRHALEALSLLASWHEGQGQLEQAEMYARQQLEIEPWWEEAHLQLMRALAQQGKCSQAVAQFEACRKALRKELDTEPGEKTTRQFEQIRTGRFPATVEAISAERAGPPNNLPRQITSLVGREREIVQITDLITQKSLVSIVGSGGIGKTRVAIQTACEIMDQFKDGVWLCSLASLNEPDLVPVTAARALGLSIDAGQHSLENLVDYLESRRLLLILDNCEHLLDACADLAEAVLPHCPRVSILVTSRQPLGVMGECLYPLTGLTIPDTKSSSNAEGIEQFESVRLFVERARSIQPGFRLNENSSKDVAQICNRLAGIPLAIEMAAARVNVLPVGKIALHLRQGIDLLRSSTRTTLTQQQTLRGCLDWSYALLTEQEQGLFRSLAAFADSWTLEAMRAVCCGDGQSELDSIDLLEDLVSKSLINMECLSENESRYRMLEPVRQYAGEKLAMEKLGDSGEMEQVRDRHLFYYEDLARQADQGLVGANQVKWLQILEQELANLRQALSWANDESGPLEARLVRGLRILSTLIYFWQFRRRNEEAIRWFQRLLGLAEQRGIEKDNRPAIAQAYALALCVYGWFLDISGGIKEGRFYCKKSLSIVDELGTTGRHAGSLARIIWARNFMTFEQGYPETKAYLEELYKEFEAVGDQYYMASTIFGLGQLAIYHFDVKERDELLAKSLDLFRSLGCRHVVPQVLMSQSRAAAYMGDIEHTKQLMDEVRNSLAGIENDILAVTMMAYQMLGEVAWQLGDYTQAIADTRIAHAIDQKYIVKSLCGMELLGFIALSQGEYIQAEKIFTDILDFALSKKWGYYINQAHLGLGHLAWVAGEYRQAANHFEEVLAQPYRVELKIKALAGLAMTSFSRSDLASTVKWLDQALITKIQTKFLIVENNTTIEQIAAFAVEVKNFATAACLMGATQNSYLFNRPTYPPPMREWIDRAIETAREILGQAAFSEACEQGRAMDYHQMLDYAVSVVKRWLVNLKPEGVSTR